MNAAFSHCADVPLGPYFIQCLAAGQTKKAIMISSMAEPIFIQRSILESRLLGRKNTAPFPGQ